tara:strand:- start:384 stop:671 length:288 start_codon:yes stop_codon:yes gene_type:complete
MLKTLKEIIENREYKELTHFKLDDIYNVDENYSNLKLLIKNINFEKPIKYYITKTLEIDSINIIDINNIRYIEFENDLYEYTNKGLNNSKELIIN